MTPEFFQDKLQLVSPTQDRTNVEKIAFMDIKSHPNYQENIVNIWNKNQKNNSVFWGFLNINETNRRNKEDIKYCQNIGKKKNIIQISCEFIERGNERVSLFKEKNNIFMRQMKFQVD